MNGLLHQLGVSLRLHFRNKMALLYSYLFPVIFLVAFWVLYRHERVPLARHMGELLTISVLGGACFGLPTSLVSERERGVWRRYRLAPLPTGSLVTSTVIARYFLLITAGLLQLALAMSIGMPLPRHPLDLWVAFTFVSFAFLGLGLVIAMMADTVPAVQALGQCIFLPMLIIGGVAVPLATLPDWGQHLSAFFPGRYAVEALQACVTGDGLSAARFSLLALALIGMAGSLAGAKMFRWDAQQRFATSAGKGWVVVALLAWAAAGLMAETRGRILPVTPVATQNQTAPPAVVATPSVGSDQTAPTPPVTPPSTAPPAGSPGRPSPDPATVRPSDDLRDVPGHADRREAQGRPGPGRGTTSSGSPRMESSGEPRSSERQPLESRVLESRASEPASPRTPESSSWRTVTMAHIDRDLNFQRLPSDAGVVTPIAPMSEDPDPEIVDQLNYMAIMLHQWKPGQVDDPVQRVRNFLYVAAVPDVFQMEPLERFVPLVVFDHLQQNISKDELIKALYWIALHPYEGDDKAVDELRPLGLGSGPGDMQTTRERVAIYGVKLLGRITGRIVPK